MRKINNPKEKDAFLRFLTRHLPVLEPPEDFAYRASRYIRQERSDFALILHSMARKLVPVFMSLAILASILTYFLTVNIPVNELETELLFETQEQKEITVEYVVDNIGPLVPKGGK